MDAAELKKLQESVAATQAENRRLRERMALSDAATLGRTLLTESTLPEAARARVISRCVSAVTLTEAGELDTAAFTEAVTREAKDEAAYIDRITGGASPRGVGGGAVETDPVKLAESRRASQIESWMGMGYTKDQAEKMTGVN